MMKQVFEDDFFKSNLFDADRGLILKARRMPIGTVSKGRRKVAEGEWRDVKVEGALAGVLSKLRSEAKGYGSADEFAAAKIDSYHGQGAGGLSDDKPMFFAGKREHAEWYSRERGGGDGKVIGAAVISVKPFNVIGREQAMEFIRLINRAGIKVKPEFSSGGGWSIPYEQTKPIRDNSPYDGDNLMDWLYVPAVRERLKKEGYDAVRSTDALENSEIDIVVPLSRKNVLTETELKSIYHELKGGEK